MKCLKIAAMLTIAAVILAASPVKADILAMMNYESKPKKNQKRREGIMVVDVDPRSKTFGNILMDIPLPPDLLAHHIFYNKDMTKAYLTALGKPLLHVIDMKRFPYRLKQIAVPTCKIGEDLVFSDDNKTWRLTCMGSQNVIVGDAAADKVTGEIKLPKPYPHGIAVHNGIDRALVTSTVRDSDLGDAGETITVIQASTNRVLSLHKVSNKPSPSREAPVEILFVPGANPPIAYVTNMFGGSIWASVWDPAKKDFKVQEAFNLGEIKAGVPLEMYFNKRADRFYLTTAKPGGVHIFDISNPTRPKLLKTLLAAEGAHHVAFTKNEPTPSCRISSSICRG
jgi:hypothetical protein